MQNAPLENGFCKSCRTAYEVMHEALKFSDSVLAWGARECGRAKTKRLIEELWSASVKDYLSESVSLISSACLRPNRREGIGAFNEKRSQLGKC